MVPIECSRAFCVLNSDYMDQAFTQKTKKGELVNKAFAVAYENSRNQYQVVDPCAVIVAFCPELVEEWYERPCFIELEGKFTKGMVVIDWYDRSFEQTWNTAIVAHLQLEPVIELLIESVKD